jgi:hypothetical protein
MLDIIRKSESNMVLFNSLENYKIYGEKILDITLVLHIFLHSSIVKFPRR